MAPSLRSSLANEIHEVGDKTHDGPRFLTRGWQQHRDLHCLPLHAQDGLLIEPLRLRAIVGRYAPQLHQFAAGGWRSVIVGFLHGSPAGARSRSINARCFSAWVCRGTTAPRMVLERPDSRPHGIGRGPRPGPLIPTWKSATRSALAIAGTSRAVVLSSWQVRHKDLAVAERGIPRQLPCDDVVEL